MSFELAIKTIGKSMVTVGTRA